MALAVEPLVKVLAAHIQPPGNLCLPAAQAHKLDQAFFFVGNIV